MGMRFVIGQSEDLLDAGASESELASTSLNKTFSSLMVGYFNILQDSPEREQCSHRTRKKQDEWYREVSNSNASST
jgi:hypothetical protein